MLHGIEIIDVAEVARRDDDVLVAVQVHVQEGGLPRPVGRGHAGKICDLFKGAVPAVVEKHAPVNLRPVINGPDRRTRRPGKHELAFPPLPVLGQHVQHVEIHLAVPIRVAASISRVTACSRRRKASAGQARK